MMKALPNLVLACALLALCVADAMAGRRGVRIDFGGWGDSLVFGTADCPGSATNSDSVLWNGFDFNGSSFDLYTVNTYCQVPASYEESLGTGDYLNSFLIPPDEAGLAAKIGENQDEPFITARRYTFLDGDTFDENTEGFQWAFYYFPNGITLVTLYGDLPIDGAKFDPWITKGDDIIWDSLEDGYDGEYFCFNGSNFAGFWDGSNVGSNPAAGCILPPPPEQVFSNGFEDAGEF